MQIVHYNSSHKELWDSFVDLSKNGTFLFRRDFMEYHADRFEDCSFLFFDKEKLVALLPGNVQGDAYYSHQGLTYGGFVMSTKTTAVQLLGALGLLVSYLKDLFDTQYFFYKPVPFIYHRYPAEEDLYALFRLGGVLVERKISSVVELAHRIDFSKLRKRGVAKAYRNGLRCSARVGFDSYWEVLYDTLYKRHHTSPVHSLKEILLLKEIFPDNIRLFGVEKGDTLLGGCLMFETSEVAHVQYIAASDEGRKEGALDVLFEYLINEVYPNSCRYFDFGTSTEQGGRFLNEGLIFQKEGFGGRAVVYDTYRINIQ